MATPRLRDQGPVRQPVDVPDRMEPIANWSSGDAFVELWIDRAEGDGVVLAVTPAGSEHVGDITDAGGTCLVKWRESFADRPVSWQNAQTAIVRARIAGESPL